MRGCLACCSSCHSRVSAKHDLDLQDLMLSEELWSDCSLLRSQFSLYERECLYCTVYDTICALFMSELVTFLICISWAPGVLATLILL